MKTRPVVAQYRLCNQDVLKETFLFSHLKMTGTSDHLCMSSLKKGHTGISVERQESSCSSGFYYPGVFYIDERRGEVSESTVAVRGLFWLSYC